MVEADSVPPLRLSGGSPDSRSGDATDWQVVDDARLCERRLAAVANSFVILTADGDASFVFGPRVSAARQVCLANGGGWKSGMSSSCDLTWCSTPVLSHKDASK